MKECLHNLGTGSNFLELTYVCMYTHTHPIKKQTDLLHSLIIKNNCSGEDIIKTVKRQVAGWKQIFGIHISDKISLCRIYKEHLQINNKKTNDLLKRGKRIRYFIKVYIYKWTITTTKYAERLSPQENINKNYKILFLTCWNIQWLK